LSLTGEVEDLEVELLTGTKSAQLYLSISWQVHSSGETYIQGIIHDITNLKRIEAGHFSDRKTAVYGDVVADPGS